jgi:hypothetical protein
MSNAPVVVVGAGPAGLAVAAALSLGDGDVLVLERGAGVGTNWRARYDGLRLNTVRWYSHLPGAPIPARMGRWVGRDDYVDYLDSYARRRRLRIHTGVEAQRIDSGAAAGTRWRVSTNTGDVDAVAVVVATGAFDAPVLPRWPGLSEFRGGVRHASEYRNPEPYVGRHVLVVGAGASGLEIANLLAAGGAARVDLSIRSCQNLFTREWRGLPLTPPPVAQQIPTPVLDVGGRLTRLLLGSRWPSPLPQPQAGLGTALRRDGQEPVVADGLVEALREGRIGLVPGVTGLRMDAVVLDDGRTLHPDAVIAATGYTHTLAKLVGHLDVLDPGGAPRGPARPGLAFIGFEPTVTGRLVQMRRQAGQVARAVRSALA